MRLRDAYAAHYPVADLAPRTRAKHRHTLAAWERLTDDPPVDRIDDDVAARFREAALDAGLAPSTVNMLWADVRAFLRRLGPREHRNPGGLGIIAHVPHMRPVRDRRRRPRRLPLDDVSRAYVAAKAATWPRWCPPADWWRALIVVAYTTGLRRGDLFGLRWEDVTDGPSLVLTESKTWHEREVPLHPAAVAHLERLPGREGRIFRGMTGSGGRLYKVLGAIIEAAGVPRFGLHDLRRAGAAEVDRVRPGFGPIFLGHSPRTTAARFYIDPTPELREAVEAMRLPDGFRSGPGMAARSEKRQREERAAVIRQATFNPADFDFGDGVAFHRGTPFRLVGHKRTVLRHLVMSPEGVSAGTLLEAVYGAAEPSPSRLRRVHSLVAEVRALLRDVMTLPEHHDPVPCIVRAGLNAKWSLRC